MVRMLLVFAVCLSAAAAPSSLIGRWRSLATSQGGIGAMFEFHPDGVVDYSPGAVVESDYRVDGDELVLPPGTKTGPEQRQTIEWLGDDHFLLKAKDTAGDELSRKGARVDPKHPILGEWTGTREMAGQLVEVRWFFYANGKDTAAHSVSHAARTLRDQQTNDPGRVAWP